MPAQDIRTVACVPAITSPLALAPWLAVWLDASKIGYADGAAVGAWTDLSGRGNHAVQAVAANQPVFKGNVANGLPGVKFNNTVQGSATVWMTMPTAALGTKVGTVLAVVTPTPAWPDGTNSWGGPVSHSRFGAVDPILIFNAQRIQTMASAVYAVGFDFQGFQQPTWSGGTTHIYGFSYDLVNRIGSQMSDGIISNINSNGAWPDDTSAGIVAAGQTNLGRDDNALQGNQGFNGHIHEVVSVADRWPVASEMAQLVGYLRAKWGTP
jgi:hypothetical protein